MSRCRSTCILGRPLPAALGAYINDQLLCLAGERFAVVDITATPSPFSIRQHLGTHSMHNGGQLWLVTRVEEYCFATAGLLRTRAEARTQTLTGPRQLWMEGCPSILSQGCSPCPGSYAARVAISWPDRWQKHFLPHKPLAICVFRAF